MEPQQPNLDELISGMLDGELTNAEARRLDAEMKANPSLQAKMDELASLRTSLLRGRPTGRLPKSFAANVTSLAKERAIELGDDAPEWLQANEKPLHQRTPGSPSLPEVPNAEYSSRAWIPIASICSAICIAGLVFILRLSDPQPQPIVNLPPFQQSGEVNTASAEELLQSQSTTSETDASSRSGSSLALNETGNEKRSSETADIALIPPMKDSQDGVIKSTLEGMELDVPNTNSDNIAKSDSTSKVDDTKIDNAKVDSAVTTNKMGAEPNKLENGLVGTKAKRSKGSAPVVSAGRMLFAVHVDMDRIASENNALDQIFVKHGIAAIEELAINDEQLQFLLTTGLAGSVSHEGNSIVLLKGKSKSIDKAVMEIYSQFKDFPAIGMNVLMGEEVKELERQFSTISIASAPAPKRLMVKNDSGIFSRFSDGKRKAKKSPNNGGLPKNPILVDDGESLMLLLIREVE